MIPRNLPPFNSVPATGDAIIPVIPQGMTYLGILLTLGGTAFTKAMITAITVTLGGKDIWNGITGTHMDNINSYYGFVTDAAHLFLPFADMEALDRVSYDVGGIDTSFGYTDFQLKIGIAGATAPALSALAYLAPPQTRGTDYKAMFRQLRKSTPSAPSINTHDLKVALGGRTRAYLKALHMFNGFVTHFEVKKDGFSLQDKTAKADMQFLQAQRERAIVAGLLSYDTMLQNDVSRSIPTMKALDSGVVVPADFEFKATVSAADNITAYTDMYATLDNV